MARKTAFTDVVPYDVPSSLEALTDPQAGIIELPVDVYWGPDRIIDLSEEWQQAKMYQAVIRTGSTAQQESLLNRSLLVAIWPALILPPRCQQVCETAFPKLIS